MCDMFLGQSYIIWSLWASTWSLNLVVLKQFCICTALAFRFVFLMVSSVFFVVVVSFLSEEAKILTRNFGNCIKTFVYFWVFSHVCKIDLCSALYYVLSFAILFQVFSCICGGSLFFLSCLIIRCLCLFSAFSLLCLLCIHIEGMASPTPLTSCPPVYQWAQNFNKLTALAACACLVSIKNPRALVLPTLTWRSAVGECKL